jgi:hypothetical protein
LGASSAFPSRDGWRRAGLVLGFGALLYGNTLANDLVWDDRLTARAASDHPLAALTSRTGSYYRPVVMLSFALDGALWGDRPAGFHATNLTAHVAVACLTGALAAAVGLGPGAALASALVFVAHPVQTEAVAYVSGRTDVLCALFVLLALLAWRRARGPADSFACASAAAFVLALLCKEAAVALPLALLLPGAHPMKPAPRPVLPLVVAAAGLLLVATGGGPPLAFAGLGRRLPAIAGAALAQLGLLAWPVDLHLERLVAVPGWSAFAALGAWAAVLAVLIGLVVLARRVPGGLFLLGVAALAYAPVSGLVPVYPALATRALFTAEHFLYLPLVGLAPLVVGAVAAYWPASARRLAPVALGALLAGWAVIVVARNRDWRTEESIFRDTIRHQPPVARIWFNLGNLALAAGRLDEAEQLYDAALAREPDDAGTHLNLGIVCQRQGRLDEAERHYRAALASPALRPDAERAIAAIAAARAHLDRPTAP